MQICRIWHILLEVSDKPLVLLHVDIKTPPLSTEARLELGFLLRALQQGESLALPHSPPMPAIGPSCHELRVRDRDNTWRLVYRIDEDAIVVVDLFAKKSRTTPKPVIDRATVRLAAYDKDA